MKLCFKCGIAKPTEEFARNPARPDGLNSQCRSCHSQYRRQHYLKNRQKYKDKARAWAQIAGPAYDEFIRKIKDRPCADCRQKFHHVSMDFDHVRGNKVKNVAAMRLLSRERVIEEITKCDVVCANCHRIRTFTNLQKKKKAQCE